MYQLIYLYIITYHYYIYNNGQSIIYNNNIIIIINNIYYVWNNNDLYFCDINEIYLLHVDDGRVLKALNTRSPESRDNVGQVIVSDVQVLRFGK